MIKIFLKNDNIHTVTEVMELLCKLDFEYLDAKRIISIIEERGECEILKTTVEKAFFKIEKMLNLNKFNYSIKI